jgi:hypothetical protein
MYVWTIDTATNRRMKTIVTLKRLASRPRRLR